MMMLLLLLLFSLVAGYYVIVYIGYRRKLSKFPGPPAFPLIGNCYTSQLFVFNKYLVKLRDQYGKIFTFFNFSTPFIVVCDAVVVRRVLSDIKTFPKDKIYLDKFQVVGGEGLVSSMGEKHRKDRAMLGKYFIRSNISKFVEKMNSIANDILIDFIPQKLEGPTVCNVEPIFSRLSLRLIMNYALGGDLSQDLTLEEEVYHKVARCSALVGRLLVFNLPTWDWLPVVRELKDSLAFGNEVFRSFINARKEKLASGEVGPETDDCLTAMFRDNLSEKEMLEHIVTLISAGHDTTAFHLSYTVYLLAKNPHIQEKLYAHIQEFLKGKTEISFDDLAEMNYLQCVMMESLRIYPIIPSISRGCIEDTYIPEADVTLPKGLVLIIPLIVVNRDPDIWENPHEFQPSRFEKIGNDFASPKHGYFPFGFGIRTCLGNTFAQIESAIVLCKLMSKYTFSPDPKFKIEIQAGISLVTSNGMNVILTPRK
jgi:cholesterol 24(S)-hydroxylase